MYLLVPLSLLNNLRKALRNSVKPLRDYLKHIQKTNIYFTEAYDYGEEGRDS